MYSTSCGCTCGCVVPYYSPYARYYPVTYAYPLCTYAPTYYGVPVGYAYNYPTVPVCTVPVCGCEVTPQGPRGEYRVGNCLMICQ